MGDRYRAIGRRPVRKVGPYARIHGYGFATDECTQGTCEDQNTTELMLRLHDAPIAVCLNAEHWDDYVGGVLTADARGGNGANDIDHCVQLVGYDSAAGLVSATAPMILCATRGRRAGARTAI